MMRHGQRGTQTVFLSGSRAAIKISFEKRRAMLSRRALLRLGSFGAGLAWSPSLQAQRGGAPALSGSVPPSIAALQSMKDRARPFTNQERLARIEKAKRLMAAEKIDAILMTGGSSPQYFANMSFGGGERLWALLIPAKGEPFIVCPAFEEDRVREVLTDSPFSPNIEIRTFQEDESPFERVAAGLKNRSIASGRLGIEETVKFVFADSIAQAAPALKIVSAIAITAGCRMIKDAHEVECLRLAGEATLKVYKAVYESLKEGMTQRDVAGLVQAGYSRVGFDGFASLQHRRVHRITARLARAADDPRRHDSHVGRWVQSRGLHVGHHAHVRAGQADRQDENGVRHRLSRATGGARGCEARRAERGGRCRREKNADRRWLRTRFQIPDASRGPWHGHGHARVAVPGEEQHVWLALQPDAAARHGLQRRARHLHQG